MVDKQKSKKASLEEKQARGPEIALKQASWGEFNYDIYFCCFLFVFWQHWGLNSETYAC
jgi:hypothetical protein